MIVKDIYMCPTIDSCSDVEIESTSQIMDSSMNLIPD